MLLWTFVRTNHAAWSFEDLRSLFATADRARLRAAGHQLPGPGPFTLYRGVAGPEPARRVNGLSWTRSILQAREFAEQHGLRFADPYLDPDPGVYRVTVSAAPVLAYTDVREEQEVIVMLPPHATPDRIL